MSPYAVSKLAAEQYCLAHQQSYGMETLAFRFFNVYGPRQRAGHVYAAVVPTFIDSALRGEPLVVNGDGTISRDFTYVGTVCKVLLDAAERRVTHPEPVNLAFGTNTSLNQLIEELGAILGRDLEVSYREQRAGDVQHSQARNESLLSLFDGVGPVSLRTGLEATVAWFREHV
jgi:UDP-glucose 4-epimerase